MLGRTGPVPKRSALRRRRNRPDIPLTTVVVAGPVPVPELDAGEEVHALAADWYASLADSAAVKWFEPCDWQAARYVAVALSRALADPEPSAQLLRTLDRAMGDLGCSPAARRRYGVG